MFFAVAPKIDRRHIHTYNVRAAELIYLDIEVVGEPAPDVTWSQSGKSIITTSSRRIENVPYNTKYFNASPERKDTGLYKIVATNRFGQDQVEFQINIISKKFC